MPAEVRKTESAAVSEKHEREDLFAIYSPANAVERMLVTQIDQARQRLDRAHDLEQRYFASRDMLEVLTTKLAEFKAVTRFVSDCDRAWRHAMQALEKAQRQRRRETTASAKPTRPSSVAAAQSEPPAARPVAQPSQPPVAVAAPHLRL